MKHYKQNPNKDLGDSLFIKHLEQPFSCFKRNLKSIEINGITD